MNYLPSYSKKILADIQSMAPQINAAAAKYGVPAEAIAGSLAQELLDRTASYGNEVRAVGSSLNAYKFLADAYAVGVVTNPLDPKRGASDHILSRYNVAPNAITVGADYRKKWENPLLTDFGAAGIKFHNAIQAILKNPDDPAFAPYANNLFSAGVALQNGNDKALLASTMAAYLRHGLGVYQSNMSVNGDPTTGINAWNGLSPELQRALLVQFYKQGPTPERVLRSKWSAAQHGIPYVPQIGADGAGATCLANQAAVAQALADGPADFADRWSAVPASAARGGVAQSLAASPDDVSQEETTKRAAIRRLVRVPVAREGRIAFDAGAPAVPFVPSASIAPFGRSATFDERFSVPSALVGTPSVSTRPASLLSGQPMRYLPPSVFGIPNDSGAPETGLSDWLASLIRPRPRQ
ncbi:MULTISPECIES: hypothetical protein [unclassified Bradyrhizobium]